MLFVNFMVSEVITCRQKAYRSNTGTEKTISVLTSMQRQRISICATKYIRLITKRITLAPTVVTKISELRKP